MEEGFSYVNIFETKGIEYLMTIAFFAILIPFWLYLKQPKAFKEKVKHVIGVLSEKILKIPLGLFFSKNHTWTQLEKSGYAKVGIDDLLVHITGEIKVSNLKQPGDFVNKGEPIAQINQDDKSLSIKSPISGKIESLNHYLSEDPDIINDDPYDKGWLLKIKPDKWIDETKSYYLAENALEWSKVELERLKDFVAVSAKKMAPDSMVVLQEGGEIMDKPLSNMPKEIWNDFQKEFLE